MAGTGSGVRAGVFVARLALVVPALGLLLGLSTASQARIPHWSSGLMVRAACREHDAQANPQRKLTARRIMRDEIFKVKRQE